MASLDAVKNFAKVTVSIGYDAAATSIVLTSGHGAKLPAPVTDGAFNVVWWNSTDYSDPSDDPNVEIVRVTARSTDTLTVTRAQESTSASTKNTASKTYKMILCATAKMITDIQTAVGNKIEVITTDVTVNTTTVQTNLISVTIPANTLSTNNAVKARLHIGTLSNTVATLGFSLRLKYGGTTLATITSDAVFLQSSPAFKGHIDVILLAAGATNSQEGSIELNAFLDGSVSTAVIVNYTALGTSAIDSTVNQTLSVTIQWVTSDLSNNIVMSHAIIEKVN